VERLGFVPDYVHQVDVSSLASIEQAFASTVEALGQVDIPVNNGGVNGPVAPCWEYPVEDWDACSPSI
jgi:3-oxoacyl-[acyl-carrier protein] reductase